MPKKFQLLPKHLIANLGNRKILISKLGNQKFGDQNFQALFTKILVVAQKI
jgi:hypothetical protein